MKIALLSTMPPSLENSRIGEEVVALGHEFVHSDLRSMTVGIEDSRVKVEGVTDTKADVVIVRGILQSIKVIAALARNLRKSGVKVFDNNFLEHEYSINKVTDLVKLAANGIPVPKTYSTSDFSNYYGLADQLGYPVIIKSTRSGKGVGVYKADSKAELVDLLSDFEEKEKKPKNFLLQEFIPYEYDIRALIIGDNVFAMRRIPSEGEFRANFSLGGAVELFDLDEKGRKLAIDALSAIDMTVGGVDILITKENKRYILEVNHNAGFMGMEKATGKNIGKIYVEHALAKAR